MELSGECLISMDCVIIAANHSSYSIGQVVAGAKIVFDTRGITRGWKENNIVRFKERYEGKKIVQNGKLITSHRRPLTSGTTRRRRELWIY